MAVTALFIGGVGVEVAAAAATLAAAAAAGNNALVAELASRAVRPRLFLLALGALSGAKAAAAPELARDACVLLRAVAARDRKSVV